MLTCTCDNTFIGGGGGGACVCLMHLMTPCVSKGLLLPTSPESVRPQQQDRLRRKLSWDASSTAVGPEDTAEELAEVGVKEMCTCTAVHLADCARGY